MKKVERKKTENGKKEPKKLRKKNALKLESKENPKTLLDRIMSENLLKTFKSTEAATLVLTIQIIYDLILSMFLVFLHRQPKAQIGCLIAFEALSIYIQISKSPIKTRAHDDQNNNRQNYAAGDRSNIPHPELLPGGEEVQLRGSPLLCPVDAYRYLLRALHRNLRSLLPLWEKGDF